MWVNQLVVVTCVILFHYVHKVNEIVSFYGIFEMFAFSNIS